MERHEIKNDVGCGGGCDCHNASASTALDASKRISIESTEQVVNSSGNHNPDQGSVENNLHFY